MKRKVAKQDENIGTRADEEQRIISFQVYEIVLCLKMDSEDDEYIFNQHFLSL